MLIRRVMVGIAGLVMGISFIFTVSTSAHDINVANAKNMVREYARSVLNEGGRGYVQAITRCVRGYPGHNHIATCTVQYEDQASKDIDGVFACTETIIVYMQSHRDGQRFDKYMRHGSAPCGNRTLSGPNP